MITVLRIKDPYKNCIVCFKALAGVEAHIDSDINRQGVTLCLCDACAKKLSKALSGVCK